ncbi:MAG: DUF2007 domain-containing protein [Saprospiraceae bacterium]|nr:DUF2007 domain-containing protein [Bacteroidia bacterium]MBT8229357.1 DUF2007 domain-containing protein [Bacteroidia bacterium]NNF22170.1 DUF2007 domain-containing protein [Saprospiraceae bacterium]NNK90457.1 DUF2007 domain-containing protein [Saprospiraceae bacterium]
MNVDNPYIFIYSTSDNLVLNLVRSRFKEEGYDFRILNEQISNIYPIPSFEARVFVHDDDFAEAKLLLQNITDSLKTRKIDPDFRDVDHDDIEYERQVSLREEEISKASWKEIILILIILLLVIMFVLFAL